MLLVSSFQHYIHEFLYSNGHVTNHGKGRDGPSILTQVFMSYQLLDTLLWANDWPAHPSLVQIHRTDRSLEIPQQVKKMGERLRDWPKMSGDWLEKAIEYFQPTERSKKLDKRALPPSQDVTDRTTSLSHLSAALWHSAVADRHTVLTDIFSLAFLIEWYDPVSEL